MSFIDSLEMSVRSTCVLKYFSKVQTKQQFLDLTREDILKLPNATEKVANEIEEVQKVIREKDARKAEARAAKKQKKEV